MWSVDWTLAGSKKSENVRIVPTEHSWTCAVFIFQNFSNFKGFCNMLQHTVTLYPSYIIYVNDWHHTQSISSEIMATTSFFTYYHQAPPHHKCYFGEWDPHCNKITATGGPHRKNISPRPAPHLVFKNGTALKRSHNNLRLFNFKEIMQKKLLSPMACISSKWLCYRINIFPP